jgi:hypothetical protein
MPPRTQSDEKYILDLVAEILAEPDYRWQHRFPSLVGDPGKDGKPRPLPVDGYFPRHKLIVEYWETQHSAPIAIMDEGMTISGVSRGHQRRLYDQRRQAWASANGLKLVILDHRGFETGAQGRLERNPTRDRQIVAAALRAAGVIHEPDRARFDPETYLRDRRRPEPASSPCDLAQPGSHCLPQPLAHRVWLGDCRAADPSRASHRRPDAARIPGPAAHRLCGCRSREEGPESRQGVYPVPWQPAGQRPRPLAHCPLPTRDPS